MVWRFVDGKPGHETQTLGLVRALERLRPVVVHPLSPPPAWRAARVWCGGTLSGWSGTPPPDMIVGAGHGTHISLLSARRAVGGRAVVLMRPTLPLGCFDLCLVPEHDRVPERTNVVRTMGPLNAIRPGSGGRAADRGLILIGGPSDHYDWDGGSLAEAVRQIADRHPGVLWTLTTSRRTPAEFVGTLAGLAADNLEIVPHRETGGGWVGAQLRECSVVWVTEDSASMLHEAVTSGARVGVLPVPKRADGGRVADAVRALRRSGRVTPFAEAGADLTLPPPAAPLAEADRCAAELVRRFGW